MRKIPTLFRRDPDQPALITREVHPDCEWVLEGLGTPTRKYDGTCMGYFQVVNGVPRLHGGPHLGEHGVWLARREVKRGQTAPEGFVLEEADPVTGKAVGWVSAEQSPFHRYFCEALPRLGCSPYFGTYELCGPKVNGNPEHFAVHSLIRHHDAEKLKGVPLDFDELIAWLLRQTCEGIVWHGAFDHMAKLKVRDARAYVAAQQETEAV